MYRRPFGAQGVDFANAREFEEEVGSWLGDFKVANLTATDRLDWWVPGLFLDVKEKRQRLSKRWREAYPTVDEADLFVVDELSVRRAAEYFPHAYFLIRDCPGGDRIFLARVDEVFCAERVRLNRQTTKDGSRKGKWLIDLKNFRQLEEPELQLLPSILSDQVSMPWKESPCLTALPIQDV